MKFLSVLHLLGALGASVRATAESDDAVSGNSSNLQRLHFRSNERYTRIINLSLVLLNALIHHRDCHLVTHLTKITSTQTVMSQLRLSSQVHSLIAISLSLDHV